MVHQHRDVRCYVLSYTVPGYIQKTLNSASDSRLLAGSITIVIQVQVYTYVQLTQRQRRRIFTQFCLAGRPTCLGYSTPEHY